MSSASPDWPDRDPVSPQRSRPAQHQPVGPLTAVGGGVVAVIVALLSGQGDGARVITYLVAALAAFNGLRTIVAGSSGRPWLNRVAGSLGVLLAIGAAVLMSVGVHDPASWLGFEGGSR